MIKHMSFKKSNDGGKSSKQRQKDVYAVRVGPSTDESSSDESFNGSSDSEPAYDATTPRSGVSISTKDKMAANSSDILQPSIKTPATYPPRGPNKCSNLRDEKSVVKVNANGQPYGKISRKLSSYLGILARDPKLVPLDLGDWRKFKTVDVEDMFWKIILSRFTFEGLDSAKSWCMTKMDHCLRSWRKKLKDRHYKPDTNSVEDLLRQPNNRVDPGQWVNLVNKWQSKEGKACSKRNLDNRILSKIVHHLGTKSFATLRDELTKDGEEPDRMQLFAHAYGHNKKKPVDPESAKKIADMTAELEKMPPDSDFNKERERIYNDIVGDDKRGYRRTYGIGVKTPSSGSSKNASEALEMVQNEREKRRALEEEVALEKRKRLELEKEVAVEASKRQALEETVAEGNKRFATMEEEMLALKNMIFQIQSSEHQARG